MSSKKAMDNMITSDSTRRRGGSAPKAGSVWESRMKLDEVKGGIKALIANHDDSPQQETNTAKTTSTSPATNSPGTQMDKNLATPKQSPSTAKRKTWKSEISPVQIARQRSEPTKNLDSAALVKQTRLRRPDDVQMRKVKSDSAEAVAAANVSCNKSKNLEDADKDLEGWYSVEIEARSGGDCEEDKSDIGGQIKVPSHFADMEDKEVEIEKQSVDDDVVKEITVQEKSVNPEQIVVEEKKLLHSNDRPVAEITTSSTAKKQAPPPPPAAAVNHAKIHPTRNSTNNFRGISRTNSKLQSFVDLVMWRDVSKSAFIFGLGTFAIISSSYTKDLNISFISVVSYLGLVYLAAIFLLRSLATRGGCIDMDGTNQDYCCVVGEEEAIWLVMLLVPYVNEFLLKLKALFSGDPATTMKLALLLFILARCGSSITIWKMAKLGFIGVFTVPKLCSSYSSQLTAYGTFWIRRFKDGWESCSHKKAVGFAVFTLVWNSSSVVARIWAVFMLFVAFKYCRQQCLIREGWAQDDQAVPRTGDHSCWPEAAAKTTTTTTVGPRTLGRRSTTFTDMRRIKQKKVS